MARWDAENNHDIYLYDFEALLELLMECKDGFAFKATPE